MNSETSSPSTSEPAIVDPTALSFPGPYQFITGPAGCGKTTLVRDWVKVDPVGVVLCATTGIAAINMGDAVTINSALGYFDSADLEGMYESTRLHNKLRRMRAGGMLRLVVDEVSMLDARQLTVLTKVIEDLNADIDVYHGNAPAIGLTLVGDFCQLPPVKARFAFEGEGWHHYAEHTCKLTQIHRQADPGFIQLLRAARRGDVAEVMTRLQGRWNVRTIDDFDGPTLLPKNELVEAYNLRRFHALAGTVETYQATRAGTARVEWRNIPDALQMKPGALVMILANHYEGEDDDRAIQYANGDLGYYRGRDQQGRALVELHRTGHPVAVQYVVRENTKYLATEEERKEAFERRPKCGGVRPAGLRLCPGCPDCSTKPPSTEVIGSVVYMPLRLAYASTIHKSQGLSLDKVQIDMSDLFWGNPGSVYVGLSRCRSLEGIRLVGNAAMIRTRLKVHPRVKEYI